LPHSEILNTPLCVTVGFGLLALVILCNSVLIYVLSYFFSILFMIIFNSVCIQLYCQVVLGVRLVSDPSL